MRNTYRALSIVPCECGSHEPFWHGPEDGLRVYCCDACWAKMSSRSKHAKGARA